MSRKEKDVVRYVYDPRDYRRHLRMQEQAAARRAERMFTLQTILYASLFMFVLIWASGILH